MTAIARLGRLTTTLCAVLLLGGTAQSQLLAAKEHPLLPPSPPAFGDSLLLEPVDVAVMSWCGSVSWAYVADEVSNLITRFIITPSGSAVGAVEFSGFTGGPYGVAVNDIPGHTYQETVYATGFDLAGDAAVLVFDKYGNFLNSFKGKNTDNLVFPHGIAVGPQGHIFVADPMRRVVDEFDPLFVHLSSAALTENQYFPNQGGEPWDVSVDLMRRVHVSAFQYFPFPVGQYDIFRYGDALPTIGAGTGASTFGIAGVDARSLDRSRYSNNDAEVHLLPWGETVWPAWTFSGPFMSTIPVGAAAADHLGGLETQRTWRIAGLSGTDRIVRCDRRVFITDRTDGEVEVQASKRLSTPRPADAIAWWQLDESSGTTAKDSLGSKHGSWSGGAAPSEGVVRCAMTFDGGSAGVVVPNHSSLEVGTSDFSLEGWIRVDPETTDTFTFIDNRSLSGVGYRALLDNGALGFEIDDGVDLQLTQSTAQVDDGLWHHVGMAVERGVSTRLYVDGSLVATGGIGSITGSLSSGASLYMGQDNTTGSTGLQGGLDEITLYHRALAGSEFSSIDNAECAGKHLPPVVFGHVFGTFSSSKISLPQDLFHF